jgi:hypothetical protein
MKIRAFGAPAPSAAALVASRNSRAQSVPEELNALMLAVATHTPRGAPEGGRIGPWPQR